MTVQRFNESEWDVDVRTWGPMRRDLHNPYNWVRFYLERYLSAPPRSSSEVKAVGAGALNVLWLDCDTLVVQACRDLFVR